MRVFVNEKRIKFRTRLGQIASLAGLGLMALALILSLNFKDWRGLLGAAVGALGGFILSQIGLYSGARWRKEGRPDQVLTQALKGFDKRYTLYHYILPAAHVLLGPPGLFIIRAQTQDGNVYYKNGRWAQGFKPLRSLGLTGEEAVGKPLRAARAEVERLERFLAQHLPDEDIVVEPLVVFIRDGAKLEMDVEPPIPVLHASQLKAFMRKLGKETKLRAEQREKLQQLFDSQVK